MVASAECPAQAGVDALIDFMLDYRWRLLAGASRILRDCGGPDYLTASRVGPRAANTCPAGIVGPGVAQLAQ